MTCRASTLRENPSVSETSAVHVFLSCGRFSSDDDIRDYVDPTWSEDGDEEPSAFVTEAGITDFTPMCVEVVHARDMGHPGPTAPAELLRDASYADQWLPQVSSTEPADAAICVFSPNDVTTPHGTSLHYLGRFRISG